MQISIYSFMLNVRFLFQSIQISKLKSALESKESEVVQLKDHSCRLALEVQNQRTASPLHLQKSANNVNLKDEVAQKPKSENKKIEVTFPSFDHTLPYSIIQNTESFKH